jgi:hypothetical protein
MVETYRLKPEFPIQRSDLRLRGVGKRRKWNCEQDSGAGDYFFSSFGFFLTISLTSASASVICSGVILGSRYTDLNLGEISFPLVAAMLAQA